MHPDEYLKLAEVEDAMWYFHALHRHVRRGLRGLPERGAAVLDAGCGTGGLILRLARDHPDWRFSGIDFSALAVDLARRRCGPGVELRQASILDLPHAGQSFDAVYSADVICQVEDPGRALAEFHRVLRPGGRVVINVPAYRWLWSYHDDSCQTKHRYVRPELAALLRQAGFAQIHATHWNAFALPFIWAKRKLLARAGETSDVKRYPVAVEHTFRALTALEAGWLDDGGTLPWGSSVFATAVRA